MLRILSSLAISFVLCLSSASATQYQEGKHYSIVSQKSTNKPEVREYFSYYCPACRAFEPHLSSFKKLLPEGTPLSKTHVDFMQHTSEDIQFMLGKALIVAEKTKVAKNFTPAVFKYLQTDRKKIETQDDIKKIFVASGGNAKIFDKAMKNFTVVSSAKRNKKIQDKLSKSRQLTSVPTFVVNGKYLVNAKALDKKNMMEDYQNIIAYLLTL